MTKSGKSASTIRRRKIKHTQDDFTRARSCRGNSTVSTEEEFDEEKDGYLFDEEVLGPSVIKKIMSSQKTLFLSLISLRVINSLFIQTHYVPDEYWQSLEVAHNMVFGYGYMTWEWKNGLRGYLHPTVFAILYKVLAVLGLDNRVLMIKLPRVVQGVVAAWGDLYLYKLSWKLCDRATAQWTLFCQTISWFTLYCSTRTLSNSMEATLCVIALYHFPWPEKGRASEVKFLSFAAASVIVRPTAAILWILMCSWHLQINSSKILKMIKVYGTVGCVSVLLSLLLDRCFYGNWTFVQLNFLRFNVLSGGGSFYGTHPWHWYITQGYPVVMATLLFPFTLGAWKAKNKVLLFLIIWTIIIYSLLSHKEFRFLMPILPLSMHYCGVYFQSLCKKPRLRKKKIKKALQLPRESLYGSQDSLFSSIDGTESTASTTTELSTETGSSLVSTESEADRIQTETSSGVNRNNDVPSEVNNKTANSIPTVTENNTETKQNLSTNEILANLEKKQEELHKYNLSKAKVLVVVLLVTNIPLALYFGLIHQRGTVLVMKYLHDATYERKNINILYLMPCHSTPYYSYLHKNISMRFLTCEPNLQHMENYTDEADIFYNDPVSWLKTEYLATPRPLPSHIVYFNALQDSISPILSQTGYRQCASFFHTHLPEGRVGSHVSVSCR